MRKFLLVFLIFWINVAFGAKPQDPVTPWAEAHASKVSGPSPLIVDFSARGSFDPDNSSLTYFWDFGDGTSTATSALDVSHAYGLEGFFVAVLTVTDSQGLFDVSSVEIRVEGNTNAAPTAQAGDDYSIQVGNLATVFGTGSYDPDGDVLSYSWSFLDIPPGSSPEFNNANVVAPSFQVSEAGQYVIRLVVSDGELSSTDEITVDATMLP